MFHTHRVCPGRGARSVARVHLTTSRVFFLFSHHKKTLENKFISASVPKLTWLSSSAVASAKLARRREFYSNTNPTKRCVGLLRSDPPIARPLPQTPQTVVFSGAEVVTGTVTPAERHTERQPHTTKEEHNTVDAVAQQTTETPQKPNSIDLPTR